MEDLRNRTTREVLDDHLNLAQKWGTDVDLETVVRDDLERNVSEDIVFAASRPAARSAPDRRPSARAHVGPEAPA